ncbi:unnamed protein product [Rotaria sordida]|uniref:Uncharacterized protein n=1 Tax=Rotaria sordida TaxID=392033 RepID=A0A815Y056_9BILA|nr:unnamed protein product [Rotaria sordida]CAF1678350.1 unnamed protein product [Rotaria sordida]
MTKTNQRTTAGNINTVSSYNLEEMIAYIGQNPNVAFRVHQHPIQVPYPQHLDAPIESSTPQTAKRNLDSNDNDHAQISEQQRVFSNDKQKNTGQMNLSMAPNSAHLLDWNPVLDQPQQQASDQQQRRLPFEQLKRAISSNLPCFLI